MEVQMLNKPTTNHNTGLTIMPIINSMDLKAQTINCAENLQPDITFHCKCCNEVFVNPLKLYHHLNTEHPQQETTQAATNELQTVKDAEDDVDYSWVLEPVCELEAEESESTSETDEDSTTSSSDTSTTSSTSDDETTNSQSNMVDETTSEFAITDNTENTLIEETAVVGNEEYPALRLPLSKSKESISIIILNNASPKHEINKSDRGKRLNSQIIIDPMTLSNGEQKCFQCSQCEVSFPNAGDLAKHVRSHITNKPFQCSICDKTFTHIGSLNTHIRIHSGEKPYKCNLCAKAFTQSSSLMVHMRSHSQRKPHQCHLCDKGFVTASSLAMHLKTHEEELHDFKCTLCPDRSFKLEAQLEDHMRMHTQELVYKCAICRQEFRASSELVQHMKCHLGEKPFTCSLCDRSFTQSGSLNIHMRIHTGEKPFHCTYCDKAFTQASSLAVHMRIHIGHERASACQICGKTYTNQAFLSRHIVTHMAKSLYSSSDQQLFCTACGNPFKDYNSLIEHFMEHHLPLLGGEQSTSENHTERNDEFQQRLILQQLKQFMLQPQANAQTCENNYNVKHEMQNCEDLNQLNEFYNENVKSERDPDTDNNLL